MKKPSKDDDALRQKIIGLGQGSVRKTYFRELQENQSQLERFKALLSRIHDSIFIVDLETFLIEEAYVSEKEIFNNLDKFEGENFFGLIVPEDRRKLRTFLKNHKIGYKHNIVARAKCKKGNIYYVEINIDINKFSDKDYAVAMIRNVTDRVLAQQALELSRSNLDAVIEHTVDSIWSVDKNYRVLTANKNFQRFYKDRYNTEINEGDYLFKDISEENAKDWCTLYEKAFNGEEHVLEYKIFYQGKDQFVRLSYYPTYKDDKVHGCSVFAKNITNEKINELELEKHKKAMDASIDGIAMFNAMGELYYLNSAFIQIFGFEFKEELLGKSWQYLISKTHLEENSDLMNGVFSSKEYWRGEAIGRKKNGSNFDMEISVTQLEEQEKVCVVRNISERKQFERELKIAKEEAEKSDKLKTEFLAQMSHEIRTPINTMLSFVDLLKEEFMEYENDDVQTGFKIIRNSGNRIIRTIDLLLNMSELSVGTYDFNPVNIRICHDLLEDFYLEYKFVAKEKGINLVYNHCASKEDCIIFADHYSVSKILDNLLNNAVKYTEKGEIRMSSSRKENGDVAVVIEDTGIGISAEYLPRLFDPFSQEEQGYTRKFEGNGLGLALVKQYCQLNNAKIFVESEKGKGTKFTIVFKDRRRKASQN